MARKVNLNLVIVAVLVVLVFNVPVFSGDANLVAHWTFDEGSGTIAYDSAGDNDGILVGDPARTMGPIGGALEFNGDGDYVDCGMGSSLDVTDAITIAAWIKRPDFNSHGVIAGKTNGDLVTAGYGLYSYEEGVAFNFYASGDWVRTEPRIPISADEWHYVVGGFDGTGSYVYIDGEQMAPVEYFGTITTADGYPFQIGFWRLDNPEYFKGLMDDVRVYNRALSGEEIRQLYYEGFSDYERAVMRVENAIDEKEWALELVDAALAEEAYAYEALERLLDSKDYGELRKSDIIKAKQRIHSAMQHQEQSAGALERGVEQLVDALEALGVEPEPEIVYEVSECGVGPLAVLKSEATRFNVTVKGSYIYFEDMVTANCCADEVELQMEVEDNLITIYEIEHATTYCLCICDYPATATLGPFEPGTYTVEVYGVYGDFVGSATVTIGPERVKKEATGLLKVLTVSKPKV